MNQRRAWLPYLVLLGGVLVASTAAIMIRQAQQLGVDSLTIAAGRLTFAALVLTPIAWSRAGDELRRMSRRDWSWALASGGFLALHFATWISSLAFTSVASSTALVATNPIFVALGSWLLFRERQAAGVWLGVLLTVGGSILIGFSDSSGGSGANPLLGDVLALLGALGGSAYFLVGRSLRRHLTTLPYIWAVYSTAAVVLLVWMTLAGGSLWGLPPLAYLLLLGLALGPQLLGHTAFNWSIRYVSATVVTVAILGEPIGSTILAFWLLDQPVRPLQVIGGLILLGGIAAATLAEHRAQRDARQAVEIEGALAQ
ncbi:DMT family transporter [Kallotenue papyrolyticum]|uniref:DMT family transporter n=1 Tax=Kallotenue papyrolyticum TaxID=1325125 RepID=UPI0004786439|nr:DMT family transporter [Kallotenue papyrolyticum]